MSVELSIVVPAYEEGNAIARTLSRIGECARTATTSFEIIVVDDGSRDHTWRAICEPRGGTDNIHGIRLSRNFGKEGAVFAGLSEARGRAVIVMDADLQHPPEMLPLFVEAWRSGAGDVINGVKRFHTRNSFSRRLLSGTFNRVLTLLTGYDFRGNSDYKLLDRKVLDAVLQMRESRTFFRGMVVWTGFRHHAIEYDDPVRRDGASRWSFWSLVRLAGRAVTSYSAIPLRLIHLAALGFTVLATMLASRALWRYWRGSALETSTSVTLIVAILGIFVLLALGVIAEYVAAIYEEVKRRPRFLVAEHYHSTSSLSAPVVPRDRSALR